MIIYFSGVFACVVLLTVATYLDGEITIGGMLASAFVSLLSWVGLTTLIFIFFASLIIDVQDRVIWKRDKNG